MSFNSELKAEIAGVLPGKRCCRMAELASLLGHTSPRAGGRALRFESQHPAVARKAIRLFGLLFDTHPQLEMGRQATLHKPMVYRLDVGGDDFLQVLHELGLEKETIAPRLVRHSCCRLAYLRGAYLACGSISDPNKGYHFELVPRGRRSAEALRSILTSQGIDARLITRKGRPMLYVKGSEQITDFLALIGGYRALLRWEELRIRKEIRGEVNRLVNCDTANVAKAVGAAQRQLEAIEYLHRSARLDRLPVALEQMAELRKSHPDASLSELGELTDPPLSKSAVNHRLRRLVALAEGGRRPAAKGSRASRQRTGAT